MAKITGPVCVRCEVGSRKVPATDTIIFGVNGNWYKAPLCKKHTHETDLNFTMLIRLSFPVEEEWEVQQTLARREERRSQVNGNGGGEPVFMPPLPTQTALATMEPPQPVRKMPGAFIQVPIAFDLWHITGHAKVRMGQRRVSLADALWAVEHPDRVWDHYAMPDCEWRRRGEIKVLVNREEYAVISVADAAESEEVI